MSATNRPLGDLFAALADAPDRFEFFAAVRAIECAAHDDPRIGRALDPGQEAVSLAHHASADFARTTIAGFDRREPRPRLRSAHFGLTGPMGPMPFYLTELVIFERDRRGPKPLGDFLDLISGRLLQSFYRAWADSQPCAQADRPADDGFAAQLGAVAGAVDLRFVTAAERPALDRDRFDAWARLAYAGHFAGLRSAAAIADMLGHLLGTPVRIIEGVGRWRDIPPGARSRLGANDNRLGVGATLGGRFHATEWDVTVVLGARDMAELDDLLPGGKRHARLAEGVAAMLPHHIDWTARVEIDEAAIGPARLGTTRLGQTGWVGARRRRGIRRDDLRLRAAA